jgi:hypothetical protein
MLKAALLIFALAVAPLPASARFGEVVSSFQLPAILYDSKALAWDGSSLWVCGYHSRYIYRFTTAGSMTASFPLGGGRGNYRGATFDGRYLWVSEKLDEPKPPRVFFSRYTRSGSVVGIFSHCPWPGYDAGLAWVKGYLRADNYALATSGSIVRSFKAPFYLHDLAWDGRYLWSNRWSDFHMCRFTDGGSVVASFNLPGGTYESSGAAFDGSYLWLINKGWAYRVDIDVIGVEAASLGKVKALFR